AAGAGPVAGRGRLSVAWRRPAWTNRATPIADVARQANSADVTSRTPISSRMLIRNAATIPRAPVRAFQPAIAAARDASGVWSLTAAAMPTSIEALAMPAAIAPTHRTATPGAIA